MVKPIRKYMLRGELERISESYALCGEKVREYQDLFGNDKWIKNYVNKYGETWAKEVQERGE